MSLVSPEWALQTAMRAALRADADVKSVLGDPARIYDEPPKAPVFPYATFGRSEARPVDADAPALVEHVARIHIWSRYGGRREAKEAIAAVRGVLHHASLSLDGHVLIDLRVAFADVLLGRDGRTHQAVLRLRGVTEAAA